MNMEHFKTLNIRVFNTDKFSMVDYTFGCGRCRVVGECKYKTINECRILNYVKERIGIDNIDVLNDTATKMAVRVDVPAEKFDAARLVVRRAIRLRHHRMK